VSKGQKFRLKIVADTAFAAELKTYAAHTSNGVSVQSEQLEKDATKLGFDLKNIVDIVTVVAGTCDVLLFAAGIMAWFRKGKSNKIVLQTPTEILELNKTSPITEEDVRKFLESAQHMET
jgi:hypothetical protein